MNKKEMLNIFAYGESLRNAIEKIVNSKRGALVVFVNNKKLNKICIGGIKLKEKFSGEKLAELAKLDGAILVDHNLENILYANVLLNPRVNISSKETGIRHQAAERTAKQFNCLVLAISEKAGLATLYYGNEKIKLNNLNELFTKSREALKTLEKNKQIFESLIKKFDTFEILDLITVEDISAIFQRKKIVDAISEVLSIYLTELGEEGELINFQLKEIINYINREIELIVLDYNEFFNFETIEKSLGKLEYDEALNKENIFRIFLNYKKKEESLMPRGYRVLKSIPILTDENIISLNSQFSNLRDLVSAKEEDLAKVKGIGERKARAIKEHLIKI